MANKKLKEDEVYGSVHIGVKKIDSETIKQAMELWHCDMKPYIIEYGNAVVISSSTIDDDTLKTIVELKKQNIDVVLIGGKPGGLVCPPGGCR